MNMFQSSTSSAPSCHINKNENALNFEPMIFQTFILNKMVDFQEIFQKFGLVFRKRYKGKR